MLLPERMALALERARARWSDSEFAEPALRAAGLGEALEHSGEHLEDVRLAIACLAGSKGAIAILEREALGPAVRHLLAVGFDQQTAVEAVQVGRVALLVGKPGEVEPSLRQFTGGGPLPRFVRVVCVHAAQRLKRDARDEAADPMDEDERLSRRLSIDPEAERGLLRAEHRDGIRRAVHDALASLTPRERAVLRFHYLDGRTYAQIAEIYDAHRATVATWLAEARDKLRERATSRIRELLGGPGLGEMEWSAIDLSLSRILGGA